MGLIIRKIQPKYLDECYFLDLVVVIFTDIFLKIYALSVFYIY